MADLNCWPFAYRLQFVRANVQGAARDWFVGRTFRNWSDFKTQFNATFIRAVRMSDRWDALRRRNQSKDEHSMDYFQLKVRLCRDLSLSFDEVRDHVIQGLHSREMAMYALCRVHRDENDLLADILDWERMDSLRKTDAKSDRPVKPKDSYKMNEQRSQSAGDSLKDKRTWRRAVPVGDKAVAATSSQENKVTDDVRRGSCFNCHKVGHLSREFPTKRKPMTCFRCGVAGHMVTNCPTQQQVNTITERKNMKAHHPYQKVGVVNDCEFVALLDTGSHFTLFKATLAIKCGVSVRPFVKPLYVVGSTVVPALETVGEAVIEITIDGVNAGPVVTLIVPDDVQGPDAIIGRNWLDSTAVSYYKSGGQLVLAEANIVNKLVDTTVVTSGNELDSLHVVSTESELERAPLDLSEFKFVDEEASAAERSSLSDLVNEYRDCFATSLEELGCTPLTSMDISEVTGSKPVMCKPYKTTAADRAEIEIIVSDWKRCGLVVETRSPYASPV
ncbi:uncharacterized protein LOC115034907 [Acyrthosiphon pisum]|uniref:CCHC-type domain-containing protein n=1 Tax=Acyrthosiphon pisum TaxID=7029 RepID=A0A8R2JV80_ACYPI|nr:uncharacterized protein LOC115034907 [Acyrthosiphon pisum]